jgi:glycerophosphoryl diester phosphodiesterase
VALRSPERIRHPRVRPLRENRAATPRGADIHDSWLARRPIAHRGLHGPGRPENSLAAFEHACTLGFPIELDVRLTRDREVVVFHDRALRRLTGTAGRVEDRDADDVTSLRLLGGDERIPRLRDVLELVDGRAPLLIELKAGAPAAVLERAVLRVLYGWRGEVAIQSFSRRTLRELDTAGSPFVCGHLWRRRTRALEGVEVAFVGSNLDGVERRAIRRRREAGGLVLAWTVRSPEEAERALRHADNYIFEGFVPAEVARGHALTAP